MMELPNGTRPPFTGSRLLKLERASTSSWGYWPQQPLDSDLGFLPTAVASYECSTDFACASRGVAAQAASRRH
jgi:hypothetical protein